MYEDIQLGSSIHVKVASQPTSVAAAKTIVRVLSKSKDVREENKRLAKLRKVHYKPSRRGGRLYGGRMVKLRPVKGELGEEGTVAATADVLADLASVSRFVAVTKA